MDNWISYFLETNFYLLIIGLSYHFGFKKNQNFKFGRPFLILGTLSSFLFPMIKNEELATASKIFFEDTLLIETITIQPVQEVSFDFQIIALLIICTGALIKITVTLIGLIRLYILKTKSIKVAHYYIIPSSTKAFSFLNSIFIGEEIPKSKKEIIYRHELIHSQKAHSIDNLIIQLVLALSLIHI